MLRIFSWMLFVVSLVGCSQTEPASAPSTPDTSATSGALPPPPLPTAAAKQPPAPPVPATDAGSQTIEKKAAVGAGVKGRGYAVGPITTPVASYFAIRERLAYEVQIPEAMKLFQATEGRLPKSHEEFMERIVKENQIHLPLLPEGHKYIYDPQRGELMVEQPAE